MLPFREAVYYFAMGSMTVLSTKGWPLMFVRISEMNYTRSRGEPGLDSRSTLPLFSPHDLIDIFEGAETAEFQELEHRS